MYEMRIYKKRYVFQNGGVSLRNPDFTPNYLLISHVRLIHDNDHIVPVEEKPQSSVNSSCQLSFSFQLGWSVLLKTKLLMTR